MKKVLLTTTALVMTAGVASAEVTFSGTGEAGVYRTAPTAAVAAVAGRDVKITGSQGAVSDLDEILNTDNNTTFVDFEALADMSVATATAATANEDTIEFVGSATGGTLTVTAGTGTIGTPDAAQLVEAELMVVLATQKVAEAQTTYNQATTEAAADNAATALAEAQARLALITKARDLIKGSAAVAKGATPKLVAYSGYDFNVGLSGSSDNGMTFAMGFDMGAGSIADQDDDRAMDAQGGSIATDEVTITYAGYTVGIGNDNIDDLYDDSQNGDVSLSGSLGDLTFSLVTDMDDDVKAVAASQVFTAATAGGGAGATDHVPASFVDTAAVAAVYNPTSYAIGYTMGNIAFSMAGTEHDDRGHAAAKMSLNYTVSDALSVKLESDNVGTYKDIAKVSVTSKISDALSITASVKDDKDHALNTNTGGKQSQDVSISYSAGALSSTLATDEGSNWWVNAKYDLGGGASAFTTFDHTEFLVAGVNFKF